MVKENGKRGPHKVGGNRVKNPGFKEVKKMELHFSADLPLNQAQKSYRDQRELAWERGRTSRK